ncbi:MAG TPA: hypothetical protein VFH51_06595, partial [Myxococcota bacterium]|nr:hypothetical protein [Myxococcota bacterium]
MAKLIKRGGGEEVTQTGVTPENLEVRRAPIIDRNTFEARSEAQQIRDRASGQADDIVQKAQEEARRILDAAKAEADKLKQQARDKGYKEGKEAGVAELNAVVLRSSSRMQELEGQLVPQLTELA